ncbi:MAG: UDP-N-acetylmuramoyl-tripeptide--D-alanyl-D-alanine ligase [Phycisphaerales bacterium]|jgi:UDP-N-acetylmuramoyl-tripeptide--D-alanyl-D-alanine ligase|nr:UDP-N-acetylmuramoyl-tripeptide--D-alanyl-D-alanine ligase [Phycisphaerales bacterium]
MSMMTLGQAARMAGGHCDDPNVPVRGIGTDTRVDLSGNLFVAIAGPRFDGHDHLQAAASAGAAAAMVRPGTAGPRGLPLLEVDEPRAALGRMATAWRRALPDLRVIAVTGTVGKTTTKDTIARICSESHAVAASPRSFNNDLGVPLTMLSARPHHDVLVAEVGTSGPGEIPPLAAMLAPDVAVVTLVGRGHLEGFGSLDAVAVEKYALLEALGPGGVGFIRAQDWPVPACEGRIETFGVEAAADHVLAARGPGWMEDERRRWTVGLPGRHGALNALASLLAARAIGCEDADIEAGLAAAAASPHRMETRSTGDVTVIDDTWNANPESVRACLEAAPEVARGPLVLVLGDMLELGADEARCHRELSGPLQSLVQAAQVRSVLLVGQAMGSLVAQLGDGWPGVELLHEPLADDACMERIARRIRPGETVLLKGSRGMALERVSELLEAEASAPG